MLRKLLAFVALLSLSTASIPQAAGWTGYYTVNHLNLDPGGQMVNIETTPLPGTCDSFRLWVGYGSLTVDGFKAGYATLLAAKMANKQVRFYQSGPPSCYVSNVYM